MTTPTGILPACSNDELLHALSTQIILQQGHLSTLVGMVAFLYANQTGMPLDDAEQVMLNMLADSTEKAKQAFSDTLRDQRTQVDSILFQ